MKIRLFYLLIIAFISLLTISCNKKKDTSKSDFVTTELGYLFKHCTINKNTPKAKTRRYSLW